MSEHAAETSSAAAAREAASVKWTIDPAAFDWVAFQGTYTGRALINRLLFVAQTLLQSPSSASEPSRILARAALHRVLPLIKAHTWDVTSYLNAVQLVAVSLDPGRPMVDDAMDSDVPMDEGDEMSGRPDGNWVYEARESEKKEQSRLTVELNSYQSNLIKESIRLTHLAFADLALKTGSLDEAIKQYLMARDYSSGPAHLVELETAIIQYNVPAFLAGHVVKLESAIDRLHPPTAAAAAAPSRASAAATATSMLTAGDVRDQRDREAKGLGMRQRVAVRAHVARALVALHARDYAKTARELCALGAAGGLDEWEGAVVSSLDCAVVAALCLLATGTRERVRAQLVDSAALRAALDDSHKWLVDVVRAFLDAQYGDALALLRAHQALYTIHPLLAAHIDPLMALIETAALVEYVKPFSSIRLAAMAGAFGMPEDDMVEAVSRLAESRQIAAKLDLIDGVVTIAGIDKRRDAYATAGRVGDAVGQMSRNVVFRLKLIEAGVKVQGKAKASQIAASSKDATSGGGEGIVSVTPAASLLPPEVQSAAETTATAMDTDEAGASDAAAPPPPAAAAPIAAE